MKKWEGTASLNAERYSTLGSVTLTFDLWVKCCDWWRKIICLRIFWWPLRVNRTVNEEMRGYRPSKMTFLAVFGSVTLAFDVWVKCCEWWRKILWLRIVWSPLRVNRTVNEKMRGYRPSKMTFLAVFGSVTLTFDIWVKCCEWWRKILWLRIVWWPLRVNRTVNEEMRGYRVTQRWTLFDARLRDLDLWPLGQMLRLVTQDNMLAHLLVTFASKWDSKWRNQRVPTVKNDVFVVFGSVTLTFDLWVKCCEWWRKILWLRIVWWPLRVNWTVNEKMRGYRPSKMTFLAVFGSVTFTFDLWVKCCEWWRKILWLRIVWWPLRVNQTVNEEIRRYLVTQRWTLFDARLRDLDLWPLGQMLRLVTQDNMLAHLLVAFASKSDSKWRNERVPTVKNDVFSGFWLRDLDLWPLGQMLRMVTQDIVIAHRLVAFASKSNSKWRNERVPTVKNDVFSGFWLCDLDLWPLGQMLRMVTQDIVIAHCLVAFASKSDSKWRNVRVPRHSTLNAIRR